MSCKQYNVLSRAVLVRGAAEYLKPVRTLSPMCAASSKRCVARHALNSWLSRRTLQRFGRSWQQGLFCDSNQEGNTYIQTLFEWRTLRVLYKQLVHVEYISSYSGIQNYIGYWTHENECLCLEFASHLSSCTVRPSVRLLLQRARSRSAFSLWMLRWSRRSHTPNTEVRCRLIIEIHVSTYTVNGWLFVNIVWISQ